uniref:Fe2OG dioxygenase domain-containing protein n=1 Tax=Oryza punctata TaxID=4537 RepID=A0A0E0LUL8_ORYPU
MDGLSVAVNYYPPCPEPEATMGTTRRSDPRFLTMVLQDTSGGLQALLVRPRRWVDVPPAAGALVVNVGDLLQLVSNDRLRSVEHRVVATGGARQAHGARAPAPVSTRVEGGRVKDAGVARRRGPATSPSPIPVVPALWMRESEEEDYHAYATSNKTALDWVERGNQEQGRRPKTLNRGVLVHLGIGVIGRKTHRATDEPTQ